MAPDIIDLSIDDPEGEARAAAAAFGHGAASQPQPRPPAPDLSSDSAEDDFHDAQEEFDTEAATAAATAAAAAAAGTDSEGLKQAEGGVSLLIVFVHGFRGNADRTFGQLPSRVKAVLDATYSDLDAVESVVYPTYDTRGQLSDAVEAFSDWLAHQVLQRESRPGGGGQGSVRVILCGHSMGGLVITDAARILLEDAAASALPGRPKPELWPRVHSVLCFDTPFLGVHPHVFRNAIGSTLDTANQYVSTARDVGSAIGGAFGWSTGTRGVGSTTSGGSGLWAAAGAAAVAVAGFGIAAGAWGQRPQSLAESYTWVADHLAFVGTLWDTNGHTQRMKQLDALVRQHSILFRCWYTLIPPPASSPAGTESRTFIILPPADTPLDNAFVPAVNSRAKDEIAAHRGMFTPAENDGYYALGQDVVRTAAAAFAAELKKRDQARAAKAAPPRPAQMPNTQPAPTPTPTSANLSASVQPTPTANPRPNATPTPTPSSSSAAKPQAKPQAAAASGSKPASKPAEAVPAIPPGSRYGSTEITEEQRAQKEEIAAAAAKAADEAERRQEQAELEAQARGTRPNAPARPRPGASQDANGLTDEARELWQKPSPPEISVPPTASNAAAFWPPDEPSPWA